MAGDRAKERDLPEMHMEVDLGNALAFLRTLQSTLDLIH